MTSSFLKRSKCFGVLLELRLGRKTRRLLYSDLVFPFHDACPERILGHRKIEDARPGVAIHLRVVFLAIVVRFSRFAFVREPVMANGREGQ